MSEPSDKDLFYTYRIAVEASERTPASAAEVDGLRAVFEAGRAAERDSRFSYLTRIAEAVAEATITTGKANIVEAILAMGMGVKDET
jgi:hypothetical protein